MSRQRLLDQCRARARKADDKDRLRRVIADRGAGQRAHAAFVEKAPQPIDKLLRHLIPIDKAALLAAAAFALDKGLPGLVIAAHLIEQAALFEPFIRTQAVIAALCGELVERCQRTGVVAAAAIDDG